VVFLSALPWWRLDELPPHRFIGLMKRV
jgi:hypothetical protein